MDIADRLKLAMAEAKVPSAAELARRTRLKAVTLRTYLNGERNPPLDVCEKLGEHLATNGRWLFSGTGPRRPAEPAREAAAEGVTITRVPLVDEVTAGRLARPTSQIPVEDVPLLAFADLGAGEFFGLTVRGTSMDRVSPEGSIVVVNRRDKTLVSGRCYVFSVAGETTYKRWQGGDPPYLEPFSTDPIHKPLFVKGKRGFEVIGRVKRTVLDL